MSPEITLGTAVRDKVTGYEGFVTEQLEHFSGCTTYRVEPDAGETNRMNHEDLEENRLTYDHAGKEDIMPDDAMETSVDVEVGNLARDTLSGFTGIVQIIQYRGFGAARAFLQARSEMDTDEEQDYMAVDLVQLEVLAEGMADSVEELDDLDPEDAGPVENASNLMETLPSQ
jgi:hypothetical protein